MKDFKFTVIMPIYNVEKYLEEAIKSVIYQTICFEDYVQLILVNDGSTDNCENICLKYEKQYPENIIYIKQSNKGVGAARNTGLKYAKGKYINFLDPDDKWNLDVFGIVYEFFEMHRNEIDIVSCRMKFFEAKTGYHQLDYKFERTQIVDILTNYDYIQLSSASVFFKKEILEKYQYDTRLKYSEDCVLLGQVLLEKAKYGILLDAVYNYRKRKDNSSALQVRDNKKDKFFNKDEIELVYKELMQKSIDKYGKVIPYIQYQIMYDIRIKLKREMPTDIDETERKEYVKKIKQILQNIDDSIIMEQRNMEKEQKDLALSIKYGEKRGEVNEKSFNLWNI